MLTLKQPLKIEAARDTATISLVGAGDTPAPGTTLSISGYGKEEGAEDANSNGNLYSTTLTAISSDACRKMTGEINSAVLAVRGIGDLIDVSGRQRRSADRGQPGRAGWRSWTSALRNAQSASAGRLHEHRRAGDPRLHRRRANRRPSRRGQPRRRLLKPAGATPVDFSPLTCEPGAWNGSPTFTYTIQEENPPPRCCRAGRATSSRRRAASWARRSSASCRRAIPGGVTTARSATTPAIAADTAAPTATIKARSTCVQAAGMHAVAFTATGSQRRRC